MTALRVLCLCTYRTSNPRGWADRDFAACKFIRALKGMPVAGWADIPVGPAEWVRLNGSNSATAVDVFGRLVASHLRWPTRRIALVPIPNSRNTVLTLAVPRTRVLADALAQHVSARAPVEVADVLRWSEPMPSAHEWAAARYPEQLYPNLRLVRPLPSRCPVLLIDDLLTTGGHMRAAAAFLGDRGVAVLGGICAGRSDDGPVSDAFAVHIETLPPFTYDSTVFDEWPEQSGPTKTENTDEVSL